MKNPADAARPPLGATYVTTGTGEATIFSMVARIASINPPGVLSRTRTSDAFSLLGLRDCAADNFGGDGMHHPVHVHRDRFSVMRPAACAASASANVKPARSCTI